MCILLLQNTSIPAFTVQLVDFNQLHTSLARFGGAQLVSPKSINAWELTDLQKVAEHYCCNLKNNFNKKKKNLI